MARALSKREVVFGTLLGVTGVVYMWMQSGKPPEGPAETAAARAKAVAAASVPPAVEMGLLTSSIAPYDSKGRDLFQYAIRPPSAEEIRQRELEAKRQQEQAALEAKLRMEAAARQMEIQRANAQQAILNPPKPQPPPINLKYTGYIGPKDDKCVVLEDGDEQFVVKKGEVVKGQFRVVEIKGETVVMGYTNPAFKDATRELTLSSAPR